MDKNMLVDYHGVKDMDYPKRVTERIALLLDHPEILRHVTRNRSLAKRNFDYQILANRMKDVITATMAAGSAKR